MFTNDNIIAFSQELVEMMIQMIRPYGDTTSEGSINISGTSISYNGGGIKSLVTNSWNIYK